MGKWCLHASSFIFDRIIIKVLVTRTGIKAQTSLISGLWFPWPIYMFFEMRFDLGTLDSGERSLPFGLLVLNLPLNKHPKPCCFYFTDSQCNITPSIQSTPVRAVTPVMTVIQQPCCHGTNTTTNWHHTVTAHS